MAHLKQRGDTWYVVWYQDGKKRAKSLETTKENVARKRLAIWDAELEKRKWEPPKLDPIIDAFWSKFQPWLQLHRSSGHAEWMRIQWEHFKAAFNPNKLSDVKKQDVEKLKLRWKRQGKAPATINNFLKAMRGIYCAFRRSRQLNPKEAATPIRRKAPPNSERRRQSNPKDSARYSERSDGGYFNCLSLF